MAVPGFWDDPEEARSVVMEVKDLKSWISPWEALSAKGQELIEFGQLLESEDDPALEREWSQEVRLLERKLEMLEVRNRLRGPDDRRDAILTIHPGAGGTESQDWAEMLLRMYRRWAEQHDYGVELLDFVEGEEAGIKSATLEITGEYAYGYLKAEKGVHRLVRISPFDSQGRRHTSFASVFVYPVVEDEIEVDIDEGDLRIDTYRASGAGGQHVNKTSSAVRITHAPSGIVVSCQNERSQYKNKSTAMKMLRAALYQRELDAREEERRQLESEKTEIAWGNQIRSYVFHPYTMVTDHRTEIKSGDLQRIMDGDLDQFIEAFLERYGAHD